MSAEVFWLYEVTVKAGAAGALEGLMAELVEAARSEPGTLAYEWAIDEEGTVAHVYERYADAAATFAHLAGFRERFAQRFGQLVEPNRVVLYGAPAEIVEALAPAGALPLGPLLGFDRRLARAPTGETAGREAEAGARP